MIKLNRTNTVSDWGRRKGRYKTGQSGVNVNVADVAVNVQVAAESQGKGEC